MLRGVLVSLGSHNKIPYTECIKTKIQISFSGNWGSRIKSASGWGLSSWLPQTTIFLSSDIPSSSNSNSVGLGPYPYNLLNFNYLPYRHYFHITLHEEGRWKNCFRISIRRETIQWTNLVLNIASKKGQLWKWEIYYNPATRYICGPGHV